MARGWESKSVEEQIELARNESRPARPVSAEEARLAAERQAIHLSRARVLDQLKNCRDPRYESMLRRALSDLDARLARFDQK